MRNDLHRTAQIIAATFAFQNVTVNLSGRYIVAATGGDAGKAFIMTQIQVCFSPVIGHIHFAVLIRAHRARIYIEIGIKFAKADGVAARLKQCPKCSRRQPFAERRNHAASDEYITRHGMTEYTPAMIRASRKSIRDRQIGK